MEIALVKEKLVQLYKDTYNREPEECIALPVSGSSRLYFRLTSQKNTVMGAYNADVAENEAFFSFTSSFEKQGVRVPHVIAIHPDRTCYLLHDLGNTTLAAHLALLNAEEQKEERLRILKLVIGNLVDIQLTAAQSIDYQKCYPRKKFDAQSVQWDLNYFKYNFLKLAEAPFNEQLLENDFQTIIQQVCSNDDAFFMYRDFQLRNIMWFGNQPWYIDYQGGRKGPLQYDLATLLFSPTTNLNEVERNTLIQFYIARLETKIKVDEPQFMQKFWMVALVRVLQAHGAYGYRGLFQKKQVFMKSIIQGIANLRYLLSKVNTATELPEITNVVSWLEQSNLNKPYLTQKGRLTINIMSFSYKKGVPVDPSDNGGGFVFDCRGIPNPGRYKEYKQQSGLDKPVITFLEKYNEVHNFANMVRGTVGISIQNYLERGFEHLCIYFGCTGGQHRSVYNAVRLAGWINKTFDVDVILHHREKDNWKL